MTWIDAGPTAALRDGEAISIPAGRRLIAVARSGDEFFAIEDICTHDGAELTGGTVEGAKPVAHRVRTGTGGCTDGGRAVSAPVQLKCPRAALVKDLRERHPVSSRLPGIAFSS